MNNFFDITIDWNENLGVAETLYKNLKQFNEAVTGPYELQPFNIYATNENKEIIGGIRGDIFGRVCRVYIVWIQEQFRRKKLGTELFRRLDEVAKNYHCKMIQLDTTEFQARGFYEKLGYVVVATLPDNFIGYETYILRKNLSQ